MVMGKLHSLIGNSAVYFTHDTVVNFSLHFFCVCTVVCAPWTDEYKCRVGQGLGLRLGLGLRGLGLRLGLYIPYLAKFRDHLPKTDQHSLELMLPPD